MDPHGNPKGADLAGLPDGIFRTEDFSGAGHVAVAVSGGGDSTALLIALHAFLNDRVPNTRLVAVTVDHGLRAESAAEAARVSELAAGLGVPHVVKRWDARKPAAGISAAARLARYRLLAEAAREVGAGLIVTGHTLDDQIETVAMRAARGEGRGLAGIAPATLVEGSWVLRPLLKTPRTALRDYLSARGRDWSEDPSNENPRYERTRIRDSLAGRPEEMRRLAALQAAAAAARVCEAGAAAGLIDRHARLVAPGLVRLDRSLWASGERDAALLALRALLAVLGGREHLPDEMRAALLFEALAAPGHRGVLSRALADSRRDGVYLQREARNLPVTETDAGQIWDGRFRMPREAGRWRVGPATGKPGALPADIPQSLAKAAFRTQPQVEGVGNPAAGRAPALLPILAPWALFLPSFDLALAQALTRLLDLPSYPEPPFSSRIEGARCRRHDTGRDTVSLGIQPRSPYVNLNGA